MCLINLWKMSHKLPSSSKPIKHAVDGFFRSLITRRLLILECFTKHIQALSSIKKLVCNLRFTSTTKMLKYHTVGAMVGGLVH